MVSLTAYRILCRSVSAIITYHDAANQARSGGICVANHTSPIDVCLLSNDNCYALVGQKHGGVFGVVQRGIYPHTLVQTGRRNHEFELSIGPPPTSGSRERPRVIVQPWLNGKKASQSRSLI